MRTMFLRSRTGCGGELETFKRGALFAILSIRQPVTNVAAQLDDVDAERSRSVYLFGSKRAAYVHLELHGKSLWERVCTLPLDHAAEAIAIIAETPGLGLVKAGFIAQMLGFDVACLDSRNVAREGKAVNRYKVNKVSLRRARQYVAEVGGRAAEYWDAWCTDVAPYHKLSPEAVSALHLVILPDNFVPF